GHLATEPVVGEALVGVAPAGLVDHQPAAEARGEGTAAARLREPGAEPAQRPVVGRGAQRDRGLDGLAGVGAAGGHRPGGVAGYAVLLPQLLVALEPAGGQEDTATGADLDR